MTLEEALDAVKGRTDAALAGCGQPGKGYGTVPADTAEMLLSGVAVDSREAIRVLDEAATLVIVEVARGGDPLVTIAGALLETFVLGALVGVLDGE